MIISAMPLLAPIIETGLLSSFQISVPLVICHRRFLFQGKQIGLLSYLATLLGQGLFLLLLTSGSREIILLWYQLEPVLFLVGLGISTRILFCFYCEKAQPQQSPIFVGSSSPAQRATSLKIFALSFILPILNPVGILFDSTTIIDFLLQASSPSLLEIFLLQLSAFVGLSAIGFLFLSLGNWYLDIRLEPRSRLFSLLNSFFALLGLILCLSSALNTSSKLFYDYPVNLLAQAGLLQRKSISEPIETPQALSPAESKQESTMSDQNEIESYKDKAVARYPALSEAVREIPFSYFNHNRRDREKILFVDQFLPVEEFKRAVLEDPRKKDLLIGQATILQNEFETKFNSYPLNELKFKLTTLFLKQTTPLELRFTNAEEIQLRSLREIWLSKDQATLGLRQNPNSDVEEKVSFLDQKLSDSEVQRGLKLKSWLQKKPIITDTNNTVRGNAGKVSYYVKWSYVQPSFYKESSEYENNQPSIEEENPLIDPSLEASAENFNWTKVD